MVVGRFLGEVLCVRVCFLVQGEGHDLFLVGRELVGHVVEPDEDAVAYDME